MLSQPSQYTLQKMNDDTTLICFRKQVNDPLKICIPTGMLDLIIKFYHQALNHLGVNRLIDSITLYFHHTHLYARAEQIITSCEVCQKYKQQGKCYGILPARDARLAPWQEVAVDLIGPWSVEVHGNTLTFNALTMINTVSN